MIQLQIPLRCYAFLYEKGTIDEDYSFYDPFKGKWIKTKSGLIEEIREMLSKLDDYNHDLWLSKTVDTHHGKYRVFEDGIGNEVIRKYLPDISDKLKALNLNEILNKYSIRLFSQFPPNEGFGDTMPYLLIAAIILTSQNNDREKYIIEVEKEEREELLKLIVDLSKLYAWQKTYANASYLRILPTFWNGSKIFIFDGPF